MPQSIRSFDRINIPAPCDADWDSMIGNDRVRFCEHCNLNVTDLSALTKREAMSLVERSQGRLCVRFVTRPDGRVLKKEIPQRLHQLGRRASRIVAGAFSATLSLSSAAAQAQSGVSVEAQRQMSTAAALAFSRAPEASLTGTVIDINGAVVMGANVILSRKGTGAAFVAVTGEDGKYQFSLLAEGEYTLQVDAASFAPSEPIEVALSAAAKATTDLMLSIPLVTAEVEVVSERFVTMGVVAVSEPEDPLIKAAFRNDLPALVELIPSAIDINASDKATDTSALAYAITHNNLEMVQVLISAGASPNSVNRSGETPLMYLRSEATVDFARRLIGLGANVRAHDDSGRGVLMAVARFGTFAVVKELIDAGARIDERDHNGNTVLMSAAENPDAQLLRFLIKAGAPLNRKNDDGESAVVIAARDGHGENLKVLIEAGAAIDLAEKELNEALLMMARNGDGATVKVLLKLGAKANAKENDTTVLMFAAEYGDQEMIRALIDAGADLDTVDNMGWTAMMHANEAENVRVLLNAGANPAIKNNDGETALAMAVKYEQDDVVRLLKSRGAP